MSLSILKSKSKANSRKNQQFPLISRPERAQCLLPVHRPGNLREYLLKPYAAAQQQEDRGKKKLLQ